MSQITQYAFEQIIIYILSKAKKVRHILSIGCLNWFIVSLNDAYQYFCLGIIICIFVALRIYLYMKKVIFALLSASVLFSCEKKEDNNNNSNNNNNNNNTPASIVGDWQLTKSVVYYTPLNGNSESSLDVTAQEGTNYYKFKSDNTLIISETLNGALQDNYEYILTGSDLKLTPPNSSEIFNMKILVLNHTDLQWQHTNTAGSYLFDSNNDTLGITTKVIVDFKRQ
jgi:hypothetical protein